MLGLSYYLITETNDWNNKEDISPTIGLLFYRTGSVIAVKVFVGNDTDDVYDRKNANWADVRKKVDPHRETEWQYENDGTSGDEEFALHIPKE